MDWLRTRVWPMEAAHTPSTLRGRSAPRHDRAALERHDRVLTMETVHDTDAVFEAVAESGLRATIGKCMMDASRRGAAAAAASRRRHRSMRASPDPKRWHGAADGRLRAAFAPRFAVSCSPRAARGRGAACPPSSRRSCTHTPRSRREEIAIVRDTLGRADRTSPISHALNLAIAAPVRRALRVGRRSRTGAARRARREGDALPRIEPEARIRASRRCPSCGARGITVSLGADGAACNNRLDMFEEMRLAAVLQAMRLGPGALPAREVLWMATRAGARTLGLDAEIGSIEVGKRADLIVVDRERPAPGTGSGPLFDPGVRRARQRRPDDGRRRRGAGARRAARPRRRPRKSAPRLDAAARELAARSGV